MGCATKLAVTEPCDVLVDIPKASPSVNRVLLSQARPTAIGIARNQERVKKYGCEVEPDER